MVTAGCFLIRCSPIFEYSQVTLNLVTIVETTAILPLLRGENDIKKIVAYSACVKWDMFFAAGVGAACCNVLFVTHAFFKALLFLGAGSVIHVLRMSRH